MMTSPLHRMGERARPEMSRIFRARVRCGGLLLLALNLPACNWFPAVDLSPTYKPPEYVVPASWHGSSPFVEAKPSDGELRPDWWKLYNDPILNRLEEQAMAANPDLQAAAERFVQARDVMMKARSQYIPQAGLGFGASDNRAIRSMLCFVLRTFRNSARPCHARRARVLGAGFLVGAPQCDAR